MIVDRFDDDKFYLKEMKPDVDTKALYIVVKIKSKYRTMDESMMNDIM
jgi:hypothetical protein